MNLNTSKACVIEIRTIIPQKGRLPAVLVNIILLFLSAETLESLNLKPNKSVKGRRPARWRY